MEDKVVEFIRRRFPQDCGWTSGNCFYFAVILKARFPGARIVYDVLDGHFLADVDGVLYDWTGPRGHPDACRYVAWDGFGEYDPARMSRIVDGCIQ